MKKVIAQYQSLHQQSIMYFRQGNLLEALSVCQQLTQLNTHSADAFKAVLKINPELVSARYMLATLGEEDAPEKTPDSFISETFDNYADRFDDELVGRLRYPGSTSNIGPTLSLSHNHCFAIRDHECFQNNLDEFAAAGMMIEYGERGL